MTFVSETSHKQNHCGHHKAALNDSSFAVQFSNSVSNTRIILLFTIKIIEMFEFLERMPPVRSAE